MIERTRIEKRRADRKLSRAKAAAPHADPGTPPNSGWDEHNAGQGGEGFSKGYGGSAGAGTGPSGPERKSGQSRQEKPRGRQR